MLTHKDHFHGSDLEKIEKVYGIKKEELVSYSANVNPLGLSDNLKELSPGIWMSSPVILSGNTHSFGARLPPTQVHSQNKYW